MKVRFSARARSDLRAIFETIAADNPNRALSFARELRAKCEGLGRNALVFPVMLSRPESGLRRRIHGSYLIFYRVDGDEVRIIRILHGAMDYERQLFPES